MTDVEMAIRGFLAQDVAPDAAHLALASNWDMLRRFYAGRGYVPAWTQGGRPSHQAQEAVALLEHAPQKGLVSADYDTARLEDRIRILGTSSAPSAEDLAAFDIRLTLAVFRFASHLVHGRIGPRTTQPDLENSQRRFDVAALIQRGLEADRLTAEVESVEPRFPLYAALKTSLAEYRRLAADPSVPVVPVPARRVEPGDAFAGLPQLKRRLAALGDLDANGLARRGGTRYEGEVVRAVKRFQYRHGLLEDGVLGAATVAELNRPLAERVRQIEIGIERTRWLPPLPPARFVVINIPAFELLGYDSAIGGGRATLESKVIVGRAGKTPTPTLVAQMEELEFSPYWNVPRTIAVKELLPKLKNDPSYLSREGMELVGNGIRKEVDSVALADLERGAVRLRQRPGAKNALGGVKFVLPNRHDVYLHSTPLQQLFGRIRRDFSHGCIRVADPVALAQFVLADRPNWAPDRIRDSMRRTQPLWVPVKPPLPVLIVYATAVVDAEGRTRFLPDIYDQDTSLMRTFAAASPSSL